MTQPREAEDRANPLVGTGMLRDGTLLVFVSDTHIGGDPCQDYFESPEELADLFGEISGHNGPVELVLAGDFFDFLKIGEVPPGENRASVTVSRPEYRQMFSALRSFTGGRTAGSSTCPATTTRRFGGTRKSR